MLIDNTQIIRGGKSFLPTALYRAQVVDASYGLSSSGNPMTTLSLEIIEPEKIEHEGKEYMVAGRSFKMFLVHTTSLTGRQTESSQAGVVDFMTKLGLEDENYDTDKVKEYFLGQQFDIILNSVEDVKRFAKQPGEKVGKPILDGEGKEITNGWNINAQLSDVPANCRPSRVEVPY